MQKIPTLFARDMTTRRVTPEVAPGCEWVLAGEGLATHKLDGTNVKVERGRLHKRQRPSSGDYDHASYAPCQRGRSDEKYLWEAFDGNGDAWPDGVYEAVGPKIQSNPEGLEAHLLVRVLPPDLEALALADCPRTFDGLRDFLAARPIEGVVFHHPDGRLCKVKRRDFGLPWPPSKPPKE